MGVQAIRSQAARTDSGVVLRSVDRETLAADYRGHTIVLPVDRGIGSYGVYLPRVPVWDDGEPVPDGDLVVIKEAVVDVLRYWGTGTEFITLAGA
jgi:hypothetical protein